MAGIPQESENRISPVLKKRINELIMEHGGTKKDFAKNMHISNDVVIRASVYGIVPSVRSLIKIADVLNCSLDYVLGRTENEVFYKSEKPQTFHDRLKALTEEEGIKYSTLTNKMPFAHNAIYEWIKKDCLPSLDYLEAISKYFKVSLDYLLGRTDERN